MSRDDFRAILEWLRAYHLTGACLVGGLLGMDVYWPDIQARRADGNEDA